MDEYLVPPPDVACVGCGEAIWPLESVEPLPRALGGLIPLEVNLGYVAEQSASGTLVRPDERTCVFYFCERCGQRTDIEELVERATEKLRLGFSVGATQE